jgi:hypothetical protein
MDFAKKTQIQTSENPMNFIPKISNILHPLPHSDQINQQTVLALKISIQ